MAIATEPQLVDLSSIKTVKQVPYTEYFVSGHRTCQGCESALVMRYTAPGSKAAMYTSPALSMPKDEIPPTPAGCSWSVA